MPPVENQAEHLVEQTKPRAGYPTDTTVVERQTTAEERFLGHKFDVLNPDANANEDGNDISIEIENDLPIKPQPQEQAPAKDEPGRDEIDLDVSDEELNDYGTKVKKRLAKMTARLREAEREAQTQKAVSQQAAHFAQNLQQQNQRMQGMLSQGEKALLENIKARAQQSYDQAKSLYQQAYEAGETEKVTTANEQMIKAQAELQEVQRRLAVAPGQPAPGMRPPVAQNPFVPQANQPFTPPAGQPQPQLPPQAQQPPQLTEQQKTWFEDNKWFNNPEYRDMTGFAHGVHEKLVLQGVSTSSDRYYEGIDKEMRKRFPDYFGLDQSSTETTVTTQVPQQKPATVVSPGGRSEATPNPRVVKLQASEVELARRMGLTQQQYAAYKMQGSL